MRRLRAKSWRPARPAAEDLNEKQNNHLDYTVCGGLRRERVFKPKLLAALHALGRAGRDGGRRKNDKCKTVYTCPMHHQIIRDSPGDCPICGMTLVKKEIGGPAAPEKRAGGMGNMSSTPGLTPQEQALKTVTLDPRERMLANVATTEVREESISQEVDTVGKIAVDEQNIRKISSWYAGRIEKLAVNFTGQYVRKGQEIFTIYSPDMVTAQKEYLIAKASEARLKSSGFPEIASGSEGVLDAARTRMKLWGLTDAQIHRLDATGQVNNTVSVYSPVSGTVTDIKAREGDYVTEGGRGLHGGGPLPRMDGGGGIRIRVLEGVARLAGGGHGGGISGQGILGDGVVHRPVREPGEQDGAGPGEHV